jgi:hypothetical protein
MGSHLDHSAVGAAAAFNHHARRSAAAVIIPIFSSTAMVAVSHVQAGAIRSNAHSDILRERWAECGNCKPEGQYCRQYCLHEFLQVGFPVFNPGEMGLFPGKQTLLGETAGLLNRFALQSDMLWRGGANCDDRRARAVWACRLHVMAKHKMKRILLALANEIAI